MGRKDGPPMSTADELRQATREAREATRDLRAATREAEALFARLLPAAAKDALKRGLEQQAVDVIEELGRSTHRQVEISQRDIVRRFDALYNALMGVDPDDPDDQEGVATTLARYTRELRVRAGVSPVDHRRLVNTLESPERD